MKINVIGNKEWPIKQSEGRNVEKGGRWLYQICGPYKSCQKTAKFAKR